MEWKLTNTNLCSCNNLTWIPKENHSRMKEGKWESSPFACRCLLVEMSKREMNEEVWGYLYPLSQKTRRWVKDTRILQVYVWILRTLGSGDSGLREASDGEQLPGNSGCLSGYSGALCPDIPDYEPDNPDITWNFTRRLFLVVGWILMAFVGSLEHNYHINTCRSKSLLIVRRSYTQFQNKI
jgi:hypothetical protein